MSVHFTDYEDRLAELGRAICDAAKRASLCCEGPHVEYGDDWIGAHLMVHPCKVKPFGWSDTIPGAIVRLDMVSWTDTQDPDCRSAEVTFDLELRTFAHDNLPETALPMAFREFRARSNAACMDDRRAVDILFKAFKRVVDPDAVIVGVKRAMRARMQASRGTGTRPLKRRLMR